MRRVRTASGATAVQIVHKRGRIVVGIDHIGSAHDADRLALLETARERLHAGQQVLELELAAPGRADAGLAVVEATSSQILWNALSGLYDALGFAAAGDEAFRALVLGGWCRTAASGVWPARLAVHRAPGFAEIGRGGGSVEPLEERSGPPVAAVSPR